MSNAEIKRVDIGSTDICYVPKQLQFGKFKSIVKTAGLAKIKAILYSQ